MAATLALAAWIRFGELTAQQLWIDEAATFYCVHHWDAWPADGPDRDREVTHRAYFFLLRWWTYAFGDDAWGLRSFSAAIGVITVAVIGLVAAKLCGPWIGLAVAFLAAVHPLHIHYSQEARAYSLWCLEITLLVYWLHAATSTGRFAYWVAYAVVAWIALKTHDYTIFWLPATVCMMLAAPARGRALRSWFIAHAAILLAVAPSMWSFLQTQVGGGSKSWIRREWLTYPPLLALPKSLWAMLASGSYPNYLGPLAAVSRYDTSPLNVASVILIRWGPAALIAGALVVVLWRQSASRQRPRPADTADAPIDNRQSAPVLSLEGIGNLKAASVGLVFLLLAFAFSCVVYPSYVVGRYDLAAWPCVMIGTGSLVGAMARSFGGVRRRAVAGVGATAALGMCSLWTALGARAVPIQNDIPERARFIVEHTEADDLFVSVSMYKWFMAYEWERLGFHPRVISFPPEHDRQLGWEDAEAELTAPQRLAAGVEEVVRRVTQTLDRGERVWLLAHGTPHGPRWEVDRTLFAALRAAKIDIEPLDEWTGLARLQRLSVAGQP
ncbi:MAG: glycosyltransferase family 39 protein [Planctomycetota bacterium]